MLKTFDRIKYISELLLAWKEGILEIGKRLKDLRLKKGMSQEDLGEKIYVTRQTISNWENDKSYPDLNSLIRISEIFEITIDDLVKGDICKMKKIIKKDDVDEFVKESTIFTLLFILMIVSAPLLIYFFDKLGMLIWGLIAVIGMFFSLRVEKLKKNHDISSLKEIEAFIDGKKLDEIETRVEKAKSPYQTFILAITSALFAFAVFVLIVKLLEDFNL